MPDLMGISAGVQQDGLGVDRLTLVFSRPVGLPDVEYVVQSSGDLDANSWQDVTEIDVTADDPPDTETVVGWDPVEAESAVRRFMRLIVRLVN